MASRRYTTEFALGLTCSVRQLGRQQELEEADAVNDPPCHIYIISRKPRLSIDPSMVVLDKGELRAVIRMQTGADFRYFRLILPIDTNADFNDLKWVSEWPHERFAIHLEGSGRPLVRGHVGVFVASFTDCPKDILKHEVLYVGQAFGKEGERTAFDRVKSHSTLQRIYAEATVDRDIWISLCAITDVQVIASINPRSIASASQDEDDDHISLVYERLRSPEFKNKQAVALTEAGLIRYFKPHYNKIFKGNFPDPEHVSLKNLYEIEVNSLVVELDGNSVRAAFWSDETRPETLHFAEYALFSEEDRKSFASDLI